MCFRRHFNDPSPAPFLLYNKEEEPLYKEEEPQGVASGTLLPTLLPKTRAPEIPMARRASGPTLQQSAVTFDHTVILGAVHHSSCREGQIRTTFEDP
jgi:hypothetical protein